MHEVLRVIEFPMDFDSVLASPIEYHPLGTDAETGESTDLRPLIATPAELRLALPRGGPGGLRRPDPPSLKTCPSRRGASRAHPGRRRC